MAKQISQTRFIEDRIFLIRGHKVMLDRDLAKLYGVRTKVLNQAVKRNASRFPDDFMLQLNREEMKDWRSQFGVGSINSVDKRLYNASFSL